MIYLGKNEGLNKLYGGEVIDWEKGLFYKRQNLVFNLKISSSLKPN